MPSVRARRIYIVAIALCATPFAFGLISSLSSRHDMRILWMAVAGFLGAGLAMAIGKPRSRKPIVVRVRSVAALAASTIFAAWTAIQLGATAAPGIVAVSFVLGLFSTAGYALAFWAAVNPPASTSQSS